MRTLDAAHALVLQIDPETSLTRHALRALVVSERVPAVRVGSKRLINVDALLHLLATDPFSLSVDTSEPTATEPGTLRRINRVGGR
jgi:hypothetical protein